MKPLLAFLLLLLVLVQSFGKWIIVAEFRTNQVWIAAKLCENRNRPQLRCGGKCQLMKRMAEDERRAAEGSKAKFVEIAWPQPQLTIEVTFTFLEPLRHRGNHLSVFPEEHASDIFHPPLG